MKPTTVAALGVLVARLISKSAPSASARAGAREFAKLARVDAPELEAAPGLAGMSAVAGAAVAAGGAGTAQVEFGPAGAGTASAGAGSPATPGSPPTRIAPGVDATGNGPLTG